MAIVQIDGLSGTGKSTLNGELTSRGLLAVDSDVEFAYLGDPVTGAPTDVSRRSNWIWDLRKVRRFCADVTEDLAFICGGAMNAEACADLFAHRFMLRVDDETMRHRLLTRTTNTYGKAPHELAEQLQFNRLGRAAALPAGWVSVDATQPVAMVADSIIRSVTAGNGAGG